MIALEVLLSTFASITFSILFGAPRKQWLFCGIAGGLAWLVYTLLRHNGTDEAVSIFFATFVLTFLARLFSFYRRAPLTVFLIAGLFPLVPGSGIYYTSYNLFLENFSLGLIRGVETFKIAGVIALGILFAISLPPGLFRWVQRD